MDLDNNNYKIIKPNTLQDGGPIRDNQISIIIEEELNEDDASNPQQKQALQKKISNESDRNSTLEVKFADEKDSIISSRCDSRCGDMESSSDSDEEDPNKQKIPDGGWGWVVVFSSFVISMIADGISFSFGLLYVELLNEFGASKSMTSWIGSLFMAIPLLSGPIMSSLVDRYGCRRMSIIGGSLSALGFVMSSYVRSIYVMYVTFGVIAGLGLGMNYVTAVVSIAYWFEKRRNLAMGLGACGTGVGTFVYAPLTSYFINEFGWRGCTLLLAGTFLQICICGTLMRDPKWLADQHNNSKSLKSTKSSKKSSIAGSVSGKSALSDLEEIRKLLTGTENGEYLLQNLETSTKQINGDACAHHRSDLDLPTFVKQNEKVPLEVLEQLGTNKKLYNLILENYPSLLYGRSTSEKGLNKISDVTTSLPPRVPLRVSMKLKKTKRPQMKSLIHQQSLPESEVLHPMVRKASFDDSTLSPTLTQDNNYSWLYRKKPHTGYLRNVRIHRNSVTYRGAMLNIRKYKLRASSAPDIYRNSMATLAPETQERWYTEWVDLIKEMFDFSFFSQSHFMLFSISTILLFTWFIVPYFYLADYMKNIGYNDEDVSQVLSTIGITNTIGMISLGWAGDQPWLNVKKTFAVCLVLCGISCAAMFFLSFNYYLLLTSAASFGMFFASSFSYTPVVLVELVPLEKFTTAYGLILLCQGIGNMCGPPLAGLLFDLTGSWMQSFLQAGIWIVISGLLLGLIPYTKDRKIIG